MNRRPSRPCRARRLSILLIALALMPLRSAHTRDEPARPSPTPKASPTPRSEDNEFDRVLADVAPGTRKWVSVVLVTGPPEAPEFEWHHLGDSATSVDFWPASSIKLFAVVAAMERLNELGAPLDCKLTFERRPGGFGPDGFSPDGWIAEGTHDFRDLVSRVFSRSSNADYNRLLRFVGVDRMNAKFLVPERGFERSALMRGYGDRAIYDRSEAQRIAADPPGGCAVAAHLHSGRDYGAERGAIALDGAPGNCATTRDMVECLRRIMFHERLPPDERFRLTPEQLEFLRHGDREGGDGRGNGGDDGDGGGRAGLLFRPDQEDRHPLGRRDGVERVLPRARYYHKNGQAGDQHVFLDLAYVEDEASGVRFLFCAVAESGNAQPVARMGEAIARWALERSAAAGESVGD